MVSRRTLRPLGSRHARSVRSGALLVMVAFSVACVSDPYTGERKVSKTAIGAGVGAVAGVGIGLLIGDHGKERRRNALIGAGVGTLAGGAVGVYMDRQEAKLREQLQGTGVSVTRSGDNLILNMPGNVTFATDQSEVKSQFFPVLNSVSLVLKEFDKTFIHVAGHTDSTGSLEHNQGLSDRRASSVGAYLRAQGIRSERVLEKGYGPQHPIATNSTPEGRQTNRRVELTLEPIRG